MMGEKEASPGSGCGGGGSGGGPTPQNKMLMKLDSIIVEALGAELSSKVGRLENLIPSTAIESPI